MAQIKCKKCGTLNKSTAKFCKSCGNDLSIKENKCPQCGATVSPSDKFCENCGANLKETIKENITKVDNHSNNNEVKIVYANKKEVTSNKKANKEVINNGVKINYANGKDPSVNNSNNNFTSTIQLSDKTSKYISLATRILFLFGLLFAFIGIFGAFATAKIPGLESQSKYFTYFFSDLWKDLKNMKEDFNNYGLFLFLNIAHIISYVVIVIGVLYGVIKTLGCFMKDSKLKSLPIKKIAKVVTVCAIPFLSLTSLVYFVSMSMDNGAIGFGWGTVFIIIALFSFVLVDEYTNLNKSSIITLVMKKISTILMLVVVIVGFGKVFYASNSGVKIAMSFGYFIQFFDALTVSSFAMIALFVMLLFFILYFTRNKEKTQIIFNIILVVLAIALTILSTNAMKNASSDGSATVGDYASAAPACIISIIFTVISSTLNIVATRLENK